MKENKFLKAFEPSEEVKGSLSIKEKSQVPLAIYGNLIFTMGFTLTAVFEMLRGTYIVGILSIAALFLFILSAILIKKGTIKTALYLDTAGIIIAIAGIVFFLHDKTNMGEIYRSVAFIVVMAIFHQLFSLKIKQVRIFFFIVSAIWIAAVVFLYIPYLQINKIEALAAIAIGTVALIGANLALVLIQQQNLELNEDIEEEKQKAVNSFDKIRKVIDQSAEGLEIGNELNSEVQKVGDNLTAIENLFQYLKEHSVLLKESSDSINEKSSQVMEKINGMSASVETQSVSLNRTSESAASVSGRISDISSIADSNKNSMDSIKQSFDQQLENIRKISTQVEEVNKSSLEIGEFVKTVEAIASRTGILAMNASIEASHAGALGQGFSVIAKEIRNLSEVTSKEADKISDKLHLNDAIVKETMESAQNCLKYARNSSADISSTISAVQEILSAIKEIDIHTKNMQSELETIVTKSQESNKMVEDSITAINSQDMDLKKISGASDDLTQKIAQLYNLITDIRTSINSVHDMALINSNTTEKINSSLSE